MNILPKKRWHVRTKANIERVRRDEAQAAKEEKEKQRKILLAEQEVRTEELRRRSSHFTPSTSSPDEGLQDRHPNFFTEDKLLSKESKVNTEHEKEKKEEQEKWEKSVGILTYLGQDIPQSGQEWYLAKPSDRMNNLSDKELKKQEKRKLLMDPLTDMHRHLKKKKVDDKPQESERKLVSKSSTGKKSLEELRFERLEREKRERERARQVLGESRKEKSPGPSLDDDRRSRYNSQFNPHLARQNYASKM